MPRETYRDPRITAFSEPLVPMRISKDTRRGRKIADRFGVTLHPLTLVLRPDQTEQGRILGCDPPEELEAKLRAILAGD